MKNLLGALEIIEKLKFPVVFNIYGPIEDVGYWKKCQQYMIRLPKHQEVKYCGIISPNDVSSIIKQYDVLFLPTLGENFGYVILEAFQAGCPVVISDQTPWKNLKEKNVGADIGLHNINEFCNEFHRLAFLDTVNYQKMSASCIQFANEIVSSFPLDKYSNLFTSIDQKT